MEHPSDADCLSRTNRSIEALLSSHPTRTLPRSKGVTTANLSLLRDLPSNGLGIEKTTDFLWKWIAGGLNYSSLSPNYYGFVTGGTTPAARIAETIVSAYDQNVSVHLPEQSVATVVEDRALELLLELLHFDVTVWNGRTFTTGATASNIVGLACGREHILHEAIKKKHGDLGSKHSVGDIGLIGACLKAGVEQIQVLTTMPHSSLSKAASVIGLGRDSVQDVGCGGDSLNFDFEKLAEMVKRENTLSIVVVSCSEVNTGGFATHSYDDLRNLRRLCDDFGAWLHVDGAFGIFARVLRGIDGFDRIVSGGEGLELADSITGDAHKLLNVPYDCGFVFIRHPTIGKEVFNNPNAAYLTAGKQIQHSIQSPLNIGIENSRRFRALPVYATLMAYGRVGYQDMLKRQIGFARMLAAYINSHQDFELLPTALRKDSGLYENIFIIVLFKARDRSLNRQLTEKVNASSRVYVSGTVWNGEPACRVAVANWQAEPERDFAVMQSVLEKVLYNWRAGRGTHASKEVK